MKKVLILCTGNSCRSQMAEGIFSYYSPETKVYSAGTKPEKVNSYAVHVMKEIGIDISKNSSNHINDYMHINFDFVFTVCDNAKEICPVFSNAKKIFHHSFIDPADANGTEEEKLHVYCNVRDQLMVYFKDFIDNTLVNK